LGLGAARRLLVAPATSTETGLGDDDDRTLGRFIKKEQIPFASPPRRHVWRGADVSISVGRRDVGLYGLIGAGRSEFVMSARPQSQDCGEIVKGSWSKSATSARHRAGIAAIRAATRFNLNSPSAQ
jgi:ABC-type sugar transport system ATPase subunit